MIVPIQKLKIDFHCFVYSFLFDHFTLCFTVGTGSGGRDPAVFQTMSRLIYDRHVDIFSYLFILFISSFLFISPVIYSCFVFVLFACLSTVQKGKLKAPIYQPDDAV